MRHQKKKKLFNKNEFYAARQKIIMIFLDCMLFFYLNSFMIQLIKVVIKSTLTFSFSGLGWYIYIESSKPRKKGDKAILVSQPFKSNTIYCFMFYYHMYGTTLGKLNVILVSNFIIFCKTFHTLIQISQ